ncbi:MAG: presenilin family intramembrane aspartyl protease [Methanomassiliicoccales archaeon]|nr:presenilin family intramembrane aspartyl protease [Methanomassiliicoccales archaeon]
MKRIPSIIAMLMIFVSVQLIALLLVPVFPSDYRAFEDVNDPINPVIYFIMIIAITIVVLVLIKFGRKSMLRGIFMGAMAITLVFVFLPIMYAVVQDILIDFVISIAISALLMGAVLIRPEWYTIDLVAFLAAIGVTVVLGMSLGIFPAIVLLVILALYDAISVYWTKHMVTLAGGVAPLNLPVLFVVPKSRGFSMSSLKEEDITANSKEREAMFMGVGDAVIPGILVVSTFIFLPSTINGIDCANILVALGAMMGGVLGFTALMRYVLTGRPQAGLPLLNGGTLLGFGISYLLVFQNLNFGII